MLQNNCHKLCALVTCFLASTVCVNGFVPSTRNHALASLGINVRQPSTTSSTSLRAYTLDDTSWRGLGIAEDTEFRWYILNCMATSELSVMRQCEDGCSNCPDIIKFSVPTETKGTSRMKQTFTEEKPLFEGYVFVHCKLTEKSYEAIANIKTIRGWMGTPRTKGWKKLPPIPIPIAGNELSQFRLLEEQQVEKLDAIAAGTYEKEKPEIDISFGFEVGEMVKVLEGPHKGEDAVVRKFRQGQIGVRMFTYGDQFDAMFDAGQLRKLTASEISEGLQGPEKPINQAEFNKQMGLPPPGGRGDRGPRVQVRGERNTRNRKQDRVRGGDMFGRSEEQTKREKESWSNYQQSQGDIGRQQTSSGEDDFFHELMSELSDELGDAQPTRNMRKKSERSSTSAPTPQSFADDDDFFSALEQEMNSSVNGDSGGSSKISDDEDDFFAALEREMTYEKPARASTAPKNDIASDDDFFAALEQEMSGAPGSTSQDSKASFSSDDDFFAALEDEMSASADSKNINGRSQKSSVDDIEDDFFASLEAELSAPATKKKASSTQSQDVSKLTVPQLKEMLKEKGLPTGGKKADLIERLSDAGSIASTSSRRESSKQSDVDIEDDFFASLEEELSVPQTARTDSVSDIEDDFFSSLEEELSAAVKTAPKKETSKSQDYSKLTVSSLKALLKEKGLSVAGKKADLIARLNGSSKKKNEPSVADVEDDFFASLDEELSPPKPSASKKMVPSESKQDYSALTVPNLKSLLKEKGLPVSGKKADLITRLQEA
mmetsp:Transcript_27101/g.42092  ORF Transcript_27101/g.42092 Transcript_27101/m.42092 type:complete len:774 (-) Transcript_27101:93-2414(-)|eukprot:CAMPEP_0196822316 /NCGR_PEP_ID=MMETSP1362-20130617/82964_1 /TAXON_ID=163516 /ORGANISM="Leptocylindrus danicus, Strain CCMP1856" /LENGTH=773 /DNA_ID=CAMNT_0042201837 /DNA_START=143 /DNA_END=2464 /DNA_ORIENTATION=+